MAQEEIPLTLGTFPAGSYVSKDKYDQLEAMLHQAVGAAVKHERERDCAVTMLRKVVRSFQLSPDLRSELVEWLERECGCEVGEAT